MLQGCQHFGGTITLFGQRQQFDSAGRGYFFTGGSGLLIHSIGLLWDRAMQFFTAIQDGQPTMSVHEVFFEGEQGSAAVAVGGGGHVLLARAR